jgi:phosphoglucosamine mutase
VAALFGTDGVRGTYGVDLTDDLAFRLGHAAAVVLARGRSRPQVLIARDTRASGESLERGLAGGIKAAGAESLSAGVLPTAGLARLVLELGADAGAMISASHNPAADNGIKFFGRDGMKLPDAVEEAIEEAIRASDRHASQAIPKPLADAEERYLSFLLDGVPPLQGLHVVVDCANGAASHVAPEAYRRAGAEVIAINDAPDGSNINDGCGSTHPETLQRLVVDSRADVGLAHDGDADRLIAVDETGGIVDGDQILAVCALDALEKGQLPNRAVVSTVMANLGLRRSMAARGIEVVETQVGDRYVLEAMRQKGIAIGGEQSGHIVFLDRHTTGDGILTALRLLSIASNSRQPLSKLAAASPRLPQHLVAVYVRDKGSLASADTVWNAVRDVETELGDEGRVLVRASGTEPVIRVMAEATTEDAARSAVERIAAAVAAALGTA